MTVDELHMHVKKFWLEKRCCISIDKNKTSKSGYLNNGLMYFYRICALCVSFIKGKAIESPLYLTPSGDLLQEEQAQKAKAVSISVK